MLVTPVKLNSNGAINFSANAKNLPHGTSTSSGIHNNDKGLVDYMGAAKYVNAVIPYRLNAAKTPNDVNYALADFQIVNKEATSFIEDSLKEIDGVYQISEILLNRSQGEVDEMVSPNGTVIKRITKSENGIDTLEEFSPNGKLVAKTVSIKGSPYSYKTNIYTNSDGSECSKEIKFNALGKPYSVKETTDGVARELYFDSDGNPDFYSAQKDGSDAFDTIRFKDGLPLFFRKEHSIDSYGNHSAQSAIVFENGKPNMVIVGLGQKDIDKGYQFADNKWAESTENVFQNLKELEIR